MKEPFTRLDTASIDERIEEMLRTWQVGQTDDDINCLRDVEYLYHKEEILARARQRLGIMDMPEEVQVVRTPLPEHSTLLPLSRPGAIRRTKTSAWSKIAAVLVAAILLLGILFGATRFFDRPAAQGSPPIHKQAGTTTPTPTPAPTSTVLFSDALSTNVYDWPLANDSSREYIFKDGAYHLLNRGTSGVAVVNQQHVTGTSLTYQLTMEEVAGDDTSSLNTFGMILGYNSQRVNGETIQTFYVFEIWNQRGASHYQFYRYDNSRSSPWVQVGKLIKAGSEFHAGQGAGAINTVSISVQGSAFTFAVNGRQVGTARDSAIPVTGRFGMFVNLKGTEVAFSNLLITRP